MNYSEQLYALMERELGSVGKHVLEKQCRDLNIDPRNIEGSNLPRLSRILSGLMSRFGADKSKKVSLAISNLRLAEMEEDQEEAKFVCPRCKRPESPYAKKCSRCGTEFEEAESMPRLFKEESYEVGGKQTGPTVVDISARATKKTQA